MNTLTDIMQPLAVYGPRGSTTHSMQHLHAVKMLHVSTSVSKWFLVDSLPLMHIPVGMHILA